MLTGGRLPAIIVSAYRGQYIEPQNTVFGSCGCSGSVRYDVTSRSCDVRRLRHLSYDDVIGRGCRSAEPRLVRQAGTSADGLPACTGTRRHCRRLAAESERPRCSSWSAGRSSPVRLGGHWSTATNEDQHASLCCLTHQGFHIDAAWHYVAQHHQAGS